MGGSVSRAACVKVLRPNPLRPAVVDAEHAAAIFQVSQRLPEKATLVIDSSAYHVFSASTPGPVRNDAQQKAMEELVAKYGQHCDVLLTSHNLVNAAPYSQLVVTTTPITVAATDQNLQSLPTIRPSTTIQKPTQPHLQTDGAEDPRR
jgi:hypothetical protein